jgi:hypothetical protein
MKNKTRKNKKIKGGVFSCFMCDPSERKSDRLAVKLCKNPQCTIKICISCAKNACRSSASPSYKYIQRPHRNAQNPLCPFCKQDATEKCKEILKVDDINNMPDWPNVPNFQEYQDTLPLTQGQIDEEEAWQEGDDGNDDWRRALEEMPDTSDMQVEPTEDLVFHLVVDEVVRLDNIIAIIDQCLREGILISIIDEIQNGARTIATIDEKIRQNLNKYDAEGINAKWLERASNAPNYIAMLRELSIEINTRLRLHSRGEFSDQDIEAIKENMLMYIFNSTMISDTTNQNEYITYMLHQIYMGPPRPQEAEGFHMILLTILQNVQRNIDQILTQIFTSTPSSGGKKKRKYKRRTVKSGTKLRGTKKQIKGGGNDISIDLDSMNKKLQNNLLSRGNNKHWSKYNLDFITKANIKDNMKTLNSQKKREERKNSKKSKKSKK